MVANADLERDYLFRQNVVPSQATVAAQYGDLCFLIKQTVVGQGTNLWRDPIANALVTPSVGLWTVRASSNGVTANSSDNWASGADCVLNTAGNAHSWIVLRMTLSGGRFIELLISCDAAAAGTQRVRFVWATDLNPFNVSSPSITASPANPTNAAENTSSVDQTIAATALAPHHFHAVRADDGTFLVMISGDGTGRVAFVLRFDLLSGSDADDRYPVRFGHQRATTGDGGFTQNGQWDTATVIGGAGAHGFWVDGTVIDCQEGNLRINNLPIGSLADASGDGISGEFMTIPCFLFSNSAGGRNGHRGRIQDMGLKYPQAVASNTLEPGSDAVRRITMGDSIILTDGAVLYSL